MNIELYEGQLANVHVTLQTDLTDFEVYGGTSKTQFNVSGNFTVTVPAESSIGCYVPKYDIFARRVSNGREWRILDGRIIVHKRNSNVTGDSLACKDYYVTIPIVETEQEVDGGSVVIGIKGDKGDKGDQGERGYSAYEIACQNGFEGSEAEWLEHMRQQTASLSVEQVTPLMKRAEIAANNAEQKAEEAANNAALLGEIYKPSNTAIHISFDDVTRNVLSDLVDGTLNSAWDNSFLAMLKSLHEEFGMVFSLYLYSKMTNAPTKYQAELGAASSWLKWGLHFLPTTGEGDSSSYKSASYERGMSDWNAMVDIVLKLTGTLEAIDRAPRLHMFHGNMEVCKGMRDAKFGALGFLSPDHTGTAYYLNAEQKAWLYAGENDHLTDFENGLTFWRTDLRLDWFTGLGFSYTRPTTSESHWSANEDLSNVYADLEKRWVNEQNVNTWSNFVIFAHCWQPISSLQTALTQVGQFANDKGIPFGFPHLRVTSLSSYDIHSGGGGSTQSTGDAVVSILDGSLQMAHNVCFDNTASTASLTVQLTPWKKEIVTCLLKTSVAVELNGVTWIGDTPQFEEGKINIIQLQQVAENLITAKYLYAVEANPLPAGYRLLNYIESTGTQACDANLPNPYSNEYIEVNIAASASQSSIALSLVGFTLWYPYTLNSTPQIRVEYPTQQYYDYEASGEITTLEFKRGSTYANGVLIGTDNSYVVREGTRFYVGGRFIGTQYNRGWRIQSIKIGAPGERQAHLVAVMTDQNRPALYDLVSGTTYYSTTGTDFAYA